MAGRLSMPGTSCLIVGARLADYANTLTNTWRRLGEFSVGSQQAPGSSLAPSRWRRLEPSSPLKIAELSWAPGAMEQMGPDKYLVA